MPAPDLPLDYLPTLPRRKDWRIGCVGAGFIMRDCHLVAYRSAGFNPVAIASRNPATAKEVAARHAIPTVHDTIEALRSRMEQINPVFGRIGFLPRFGCSDHTGPSGDPAVLSSAPLASSVSNYYVTDPISRSSPTMAACVEAQTQPAPTHHEMAAE